MICLRQNGRVSWLPLFPGKKALNLQLWPDICPTVIMVVKVTILTLPMRDCSSVFELLFSNFFFSSSSEETSASLEYVRRRPFELVFDWGVLPFQGLIFLLSDF